MEADDADEVARRASVLARGWEALDKEATAAGHQPEEVEAWLWRDEDGKPHAFVRDVAAVQLDGGSGRKAESILTFLDTLAERELNSSYSAKDGDKRDRAGRVRPIVPGRLDLPEKAGSFVDAARYMPSRMAAAYEDPSVIEKLDPP